LAVAELKQSPRHKIANEIRPPVGVVWLIVGTKTRSFGSGLLKSGLIITPPQQLASTDNQTKKYLLTERHEKAGETKCESCRGAEPSEHEL
jgi:hypothetical protein